MKRDTLRFKIDQSLGRDPALASDEADPEPALAEFLDGDPQAPAKIGPADGLIGFEEIGACGGGGTPELINNPPWALGPCQCPIDRKGSICPLLDALDEVRVESGYR